MSKEIDKLLSVLDLTGEEQLNWCFDRFASDFEKSLIETADKLKWEEGEWKPTKADNFQNRVANLAFRLRDEAVKIDNGVLLGRGYYKVCGKLYPDNTNSLNEFLSWAATIAKPIEIIIAALIAKELAKENYEN